MKRTRPFRTIWHEVGGVVSKPDKLNKEGFPAYSGTPEHDVVNVLMTGTTANTFYVKVTELVMDQVNVLREFGDTEFLAKATVYAREQGYKREIPIASTVVLSTKSLNLFRAIVHRVCKNPHDWQKFIDICRSRLIRNGLGRAIKREIINAIRDMSSYHAIKYPSAVRDMIRIARPHESVNPTVIKYIMEGRHEGDEQLEALYKLKHAESERDIIRAIEEGRLPYEVVTGSVPKMTPAIWEALLYQAPYFNLLHNLNNFIRNGVFDREENLECAIKKLTNPEAVRNSKLFPFRFYIAYRMLEDFKYSRDLKDALERAMEISVQNIPEFDGRVCIAPDVSYSMSSSLTGDYSVVRCIDLVGIFTAMLMKRCRERPLLLPFDTKLRLDMAEKAYRAERMLDIASAFRADNGTSLSLPVEYLLRENIEVDYFIAFTDNEEWVGRRFEDALRDYINRVNPDVKVYLVTLMPYRDYPTPTYGANVHYIFGWSDSVLKYICSDVDEQIREIEKVEL